MNASVKVVLHAKEYSDGTHPVMLQCIVSSPDGNLFKRRTICRVKPNQFDRTSQRIVKHPNAVEYNSRISNAYNEAERRLLSCQREGIKIDPAIIISEVATVATTGMLLRHGLDYIAKCKQKGQIHTAEKYGGHVTKLAQYLGKDGAGNQKDILMDNVTEQWLLDWSVWLQSNGTKSANTLHRRMAFITTLFNDARKRQLTKVDPMAFLEFKEQRARKPKLTVSQLQQLETAELTGLEDDARNTFLLQFFAYGSRISDALTWKKSDIRRDGETMYLEYTSMKTKDLIDVRLNGKAVELVNRYLQTVPGPFLLPWLHKYEDRPDLSSNENLIHLIEQIESKTTMINARLKAIAKKVGITINLTTHIARHTFATLADARVMDKRKISAALGHSKFSTTEVYLNELRQSDVNDAMESVWG